MKPILVDISTVLMLVRYPYKRSTDIIVAISGHPAHCCICDEDVADWADLADHIRGHDRRVGPAKILTRKRNDARELALFEVVQFRDKPPESCQKTP